MNNDEHFSCKHIFIEWCLSPNRLSPLAEKKLHFRVCVCLIWKCEGGRVSDSRGRERESDAVVFSYIGLITIRISSFNENDTAAPPNGQTYLGFCYFLDHIELKREIGGEMSFIRRECFFFAFIRTSLVSRLDELWKLLTLAIFCVCVCVHVFLPVIWRTIYSEVNFPEIPMLSIAINL